jgi:hypothetical protein
MAYRLSIIFLVVSMKFLKIPFSVIGCFLMSFHHWIREEKPSKCKCYRRLPTRVSSALSIIGGVHIGARALHVLYLIWFG